MTVIYEPYLTDVNGTNKQLLTGYTSLQWARGVNVIGNFSITFPAEQFDPDLYEEDRRVELWRYTDTQKPSLLRVFFLKKMSQSFRGGYDITTIGGPDSNDLLRRRNILYFAGSPYGKFVGPADDSMVNFVNYNLGANADIDSIHSSTRNITAKGFSVAASAGLGPTLSKQASWQDKLLTVLQSLSVSSVRLTAPDYLVAGEYPIYFDVVNPSPATFEFRTYAGQVGQDRTLGSDPLVLSAEASTLDNILFERDATQEISLAVVGGRGRQNGRAVDWDRDLGRVNASPFGLQEGFRNSFNNLMDDSTYLEAESYKGLWAGRPRLLFSANIVNSALNDFGSAWGFGDRVIAEFKRQRYACLVASVGATFQAGKETIQARLHYEG